MCFLCLRVFCLLVFHVYLMCFISSIFGVSVCYVLVLFSSEEAEKRLNQTFLFLVWLGVFKYCTAQSSVVESNSLSERVASLVFSIETCLWSRTEAYFPDWFCSFLLDSMETVKTQHWLILSLSSHILKVTDFFLPIVYCCFVPSFPITTCLDHIFWSNTLGSSRMNIRRKAI